MGSDGSNQEHDMEGTACCTSCILSPAITLLVVLTSCAER